MKERLCSSLRLFVMYFAFHLCSSLDSILAGRTPVDIAIYLSRVLSLFYHCWELSVFQVEKS